MRWKKKKWPLTRHSLMADLRSKWGKNFWFLFLFLFFSKFYFYGLLSSRNSRFEDIVLTEDTVLLMMILKTVSWWKLNIPRLKTTLHVSRIWDVEHAYLLHKKQEALVVSFHLLDWLEKANCHKMMICKRKEKVYWHCK